MKRYEMETKYVHLSPISDTERCGALIPKAVEDPDGGWVKREDMEGLLNKLGHDASVAGFHHRISQLEEGVKAKNINPACNCEENAFAGLRPDGGGMARAAFWICPAHGYKRR